MKNNASIKKERIIRIISVCLIVQLLICKNLWVMAWRNFPAVPLFEFLPVKYGNMLDFFFYALLICSCIWLLIKPLAKRITLLIPILFFVLMLEDVSRLQPWVYLYSAMLLFFYFENEKHTNTNVLFAWKIILSSVYFWSGVQKLNPHFAGEMFPWLAEFSGGRKYFESHLWVGLCCAGLEAFAAIGLWISSVKKVAVIIIICMHTFILFALGPLGQNWNEVVWPWNIAFAWIAFELFFREEEFQFSITGFYKWVVVQIFAITPFLNFFDKTDHFLSAGFYTHLASNAVIFLPLNEAEKLPLSARKHLFADQKKNEALLMTDQWALEELKVPFYPEDRTHKLLLRQVCACISDKSHAGMRILHKERFQKKITEEIVNCQN